MKKTRSPIFNRLLFWFLFVLASAKTIAQPCSCVNCPKIIPDLDTIELPINVTGSTNNNLASATQGVCKVCVKFTHDFVSDLQISLISPSGQSVLLVAPISQLGYTFNAVWDVCFVPCAQTAYPDPGFPPQWANANWASAGNYKGSYYPYSGCLEDFNSGSVNGVWKLIVKDGDANYDGKIGNWSITFCDPAGLDCLSCIANGGDYSKIPAVSACKGDNSLIMSPIPIYTPNSPAPPANLYSYTNVISKNGVVLGYQNPVNLTTYLAGVYDVCGLSYLTSDAPKLPPPNGILTITDLKNLMLGTKPMICGKFSKGCIPVTIKAAPIPVFVDTTVCRTYKYSTITYNQTGLYTEKFKASNGCDSLVYINVTVVDPIVNNLFKTICQGSFYNVGSKKYSVTGIYKDTLVANSTGCDSILNLFLTVKSPPTSNLSLKLCEGDSVKIGLKKYFTSGTFSDTLLTQNGCDSIVNLSLVVSPKSNKQITKIICYKETYSLNGIIYDKTGTYKDTLVGQNKFGCDSILTLDLTVLPFKIDTNKVDICQGDKLVIGKHIYTQTGNYLDTLTSILHQCDSIVYTELKVSTKIQKSISAHICNGQVYDFDGKMLLVSGKYTANNISKNGCDSTTNLTLTVHQNPSIGVLNTTLCFGDTLFIENSKFFVSGNFQINRKSVYGCDSILNINLKVLPKIEKSLSIGICEDEFYEVGSVKYSKSGVYSIVLKTFSTNCDSFITLDLTVFTKKKTLIDTTLCFGDKIKIGTNFYDKTGFYSAKLMTSHGCDSIVDLDLKVKDRGELQLKKSICINSFYQVGKHKYFTTGNYTDTLKYQSGCDSLIVKLDLTVLSEINTKLSKSLCFGDTILVANNPYFETGIYKDTLLASGGCDSIITLDLKILAPSFSIIKKEICEGACETIGDSTYCKTGAYKLKVKNTNGCDSLIALELIVKKRPISELTMKICEGDTVKIGNKFFHFETNIYNDTLSAINGCDSIVLLDLFVVPSLKKTINETLCFGKNVVINGKKYDSNGTFFDTLKSLKTGCDSILTINIEVLSNIKTEIEKTICKGQGFLGFSNPGSYVIVLKSKTGCDSTMNLDLTVQDSFVLEADKLICKGDKYSFGNQELMISGKYKNVYKSSFGCDSIVYLDLLVATCAFDYYLNKIDIGCAKTNPKGTASIYLKPDFEGTLLVDVWQFGNLLKSESITLEDTLKLDNLEEGKVILKFENVFGKIKFDTITISKQATLKGTFSKVSNYDGFGVKCPNDNNGFISANVEGGKEPYTYLWNNNLKVQNIEKLKAGFYQLTITDSLGCFVVIDTLLKNPEVPVVHYSFKNLTCFESNDGIITIDSITNSSKKYLYSIDLSEFSSNPSFLNLTAKPHLISIKDTFGCQIDTFKTLTQPAKIIIDLGQDTTISLGDQVEIKAFTNLSPLEIDKIRWNDFVVPTCPTCLQTIVQPSISTGYFLFLTDKKGCVGFDVKTVYINDTFPAFIPSTFSPNDDGVNDYFTVFTSDKIKTIRKMDIFNRWGDLLYSSSDFSTNQEVKGWNGEFNGVPQPAAVYVYFVELELWDKSIKTLKGSFTIIR